jgi:hypothetical protein
MNRTRVVVSCCWLFGVCLLGAACADNGEAPPAPESDQTATAGATTEVVGGVAVGFATTPDPPEEGDNAVEVTLTQDGSPITDATVTAVFSMPAMPSMNMPAMRSDAALTHAGEGRYRGTGELSMGGTWNVAVTVTRDGRQVAVRRLSIVAR